MPWVISSAAFVVSVVALVKARGDKQRDDLRNTRIQLTDVLLKISDARSLRSENASNPKDPDDVREKKMKARGMLNDRLRFLADQATLLAQQVPARVAGLEYEQIGRAYEDIGELSLAEDRMRSALRASKSPKERGFMRQALARVLFTAKRIEEALREAESAYDDLSRDQNIDARWAAVEVARMIAEGHLAQGAIDAAQDALERAMSSASELPQSPARAELDKRLSELKRELAGRGGALPQLQPIAARSP